MGQHRVAIRLLLIGCARASLDGWDTICADGTREDIRRCANKLATTIVDCGPTGYVTPAVKCTNLAVAGAASQAVNWALMLAGGLAQHVHTRTVASLLTVKDFSRNSRPKGMSGPQYRKRPLLGRNDVGRPTCFFWTLREPAKRIESGYRHAVQLMASHPLFSVRRPPPLDDLMAAWRANATRRPKAIQENFMRTQIGYLRGGIDLCRRKEIQIVPLCTETLADDWAAAATRVLGDPDARLPQAHARAINSDPRLQSESTLSYENRRWVNREVFIADHVVWRVLCGGRNASTPYAPTKTLSRRPPTRYTGRCSRPHNLHLPGCHWLPGKCRWQCHEPPR
jgi:hypothetical protein